MKKILSLFLFLIFTLSLNAQCMCADLCINMPLPDIELKKNKSNYQVQIIRKYTYREDAEKEVKQNFPAKFLNEKNFKPTKGTLKYYFPTGGGLHELTFKIIRLKDKAEMQITALNMGYDNEYSLSFNEFIAGKYEFDWNEIDHCQRENIDNLHMICNEKRLEQERLLNDEERKTSFMRNFVKITHPEDFKLSNGKKISPSSGQVKFPSFSTSNQSKYQQLSFFEAKTEENYTLSNLTELLFHRY